MNYTKREGGSTKYRYWESFPGLPDPIGARTPSPSNLEIDPDGMIKAIELRTSSSAPRKKYNRC
ncbi:MAG: hypothetical protein ACTSR9_18185, partial [Candidatus Thorarchaeota archaeon]